MIFSDSLIEVEAKRYLQQPSTLRASVTFGDWLKAREDLLATDNARVERVEMSAYQGAA